VKTKAVFTFKMAEREGFEPSSRYKPGTRLPSGRTRPTMRSLREMDCRFEIADCSYRLQSGIGNLESWALGLFGHGPKALGAELGELGLARGRVENTLFEKVGVETAQGFPVGVADAIADLGTFATFVADLCHKIEL
jgi:hypothetical protein